MTNASYPDAYDSSNIIGNGQGIPLDIRMGIKGGRKNKKSRTRKNKKSRMRRGRTRSRR
jgi:hypothetical protein